MLTIALLSLLLSSVSAVAIGEPQQPLVKDGMNLTLDHADQAGFQKFPIETMSEPVFRLHHHAAKALLGDKSYIILRRGEIWQRQFDVWQYLKKQNLDCREWMQMGFSRDNGRHIFMSGGRIFDADPERVPQEVITALQDLEDQDHKNRIEMRRQNFCNATQTDDDHSKMSFDDRLNEERAAHDNSWMVTIPDEYLQYQISEVVIDDMWRAQEEHERKNNLAGKLSVRNVEMPDLRKCEKFKGM